jgi:hypothetical protein
VEIVTVKSILAALARLAAVAASLFGAAPAHAGDWAFHGLEAPSAYTGEVGLRFWYGKGKTGKSLYDPAGASLVSRLSYDNLSIFSAEAYGRFIGRRDELKAIGESLARANRGELRIVGLTGDAGHLEVPATISVALGRPAAHVLRRVCKLVFDLLADGPVPTDDEHGAKLQALWRVQGQ